MNKCKINRAQMISKCGRWPLQWDQALAKVPASVIVNCNARTLAEVVDALYDQFQRGEESGIQIAVKHAASGDPHG